REGKGFIGGWVFCADASRKFGKRGRGGGDGACSLGADLPCAGEAWRGSRCKLYSPRGEVGNFILRAPHLRHSTRATSLEKGRTKRQFRQGSGRRERTCGRNAARPRA